MKGVVESSIEEKSMYWVSLSSSVSCGGPIDVCDERLTNRMGSLGEMYDTFRRGVVEGSSTAIICVDSSVMCMRVSAVKKSAIISEANECCLRVE